jgi:uncharacterized protein (TIGR03435 family)
MRIWCPIRCFTLLAGAVLALAADALQFEIADVHASPKSTGMMGQFFRTTPVRADRYEVKNATMVDLIAIAYSFDREKILGGPNWLEMDRYDVVGKVPADAVPDSQKGMLQSLLAERFKLVTHKDTKPLPTYALVVGRKPLLKEADGSGDTGCHPQASNGPSADGTPVMRLATVGPTGAATTFSLGPGMVIQFNCRNMTMAAFAEGLRGMLGAGAALGSNNVLDQTGLEGRWNFDVRWSLMAMGPMMANNGDRITLFEAIEKQLGLKLEQRQIPTPVLVVDSVERKPTENPPGVAQALPPIVPPTEFEVANVKTADPGGRGGPFRMQPGGRLTASGTPMRILLIRAFNSFNMDQLAGMPSWVDSERYDITAKAPSQGPAAPELDLDSMAPMLLALLKDRFKLAYHTEDRPLPAYTLVAAKPKMKKADPAERTSCKTPPPAPGAPPGARQLVCQNVTMAEFAERLQGMSQELNWPVLDGTGLEGSWDLSLTFTQTFPGMMMVNGGPRGGDAAPPGGGGMAMPSDPVGGVTIFEAVEKQLGLKLEMRKRALPVYVIDHLEQKPTEN